ncbi:ABC transporter permease [Clavibacter sepedonicus]|uniref:Integral membrane transport protein n=1 Tax=Clavibacter sepedonicus TaxID=31964 RepID=B0RCU8_CLASE|nr:MULTISPECIES: ABC transporter permease [Clavibacter]MBD5382232.1 ABC transporter permease [Clavibacter sp.]OQJ54025.1 hypothetical protein B5P20_07775 [Clavibacter sepedonicus]UUK65554.1 ABC transporter permease [Clavibacter sepedonicus]CAQ03039.1 putative integral membrane transport protein [Clavibacter sepedonicus]
MSLVSPVALAGTYARAQLLEAVRTPISIIMGIGTPTVAFLFFVLPQRRIAEDPDAAAAAVAALCVFGVMLNCLFEFSVEISQMRDRPWGKYLRTLPSPAVARVLGYLGSTGVLAILSVIPLLVIAWVTTDAQVTLGGLLLGFAALAVTAVPSMLLGVCVGYLTRPKAAVAVAQVLMLLLAFGGGLFLPPQLFPDALDAFSMALPTRAALEITSWAALGGDAVPWIPLAVLLAWVAALASLALVLIRRDASAVIRS